MENNHFTKLSFNLVQKYYRDEYDTLVSVDDLYVVWLVKALQNNKCLISTRYKGDTSYFEFTYNGDEKEIYMDVYEKRMNKAIRL